MGDLTFLPLHENAEYYEGCAEVLNEEWKRSLSARLHSLQKSCDTFPVSLILVEVNGSKKEVVGHSRVSIVHGREKSCLVESVVVKKNKRGMGYGRKVMTETEEFVKRKGYEWMYLTTHDKQDFYKHLGYEFCNPVISLGFNAHLLPDHMIQRFSESVGVNTNGSSVSINSSSINNCTLKNKRTVEDNFNSPNTTPHTPQLSLGAQPPTQYPTAAPLPPPPPPLLPATKSKTSSSLEDNTVTRWDPSKVSWMRKKLL
ncbi:hypothetical protein CHS0354_040988 [Potamilus streckersoni]|uniref:N-acetyltransferase domain-containing protein n=1 Tax=Potamilus streckersoni TaxID=2493646 RepID=A0AAE0SW45_9BIVA|nr:hypothetical protein CHS0354_040988 [Potamilus streckersoni]